MIRVLEVFLYLGGVTRCSSVGGLVCHPCAIVESIGGDGAAVAGAILHSCALLALEGGAGGGSREAVNVGRQDVGVVRDRADELVGSGGGKGEMPAGLNVVVAAIGEVVKLGDVKGDGDGLAGRDTLEGLLGEVVLGDLDLDTFKGDVVVLAFTLDLCLLGEVVVQEGAGLEESQVAVAIVGDDGLDLGVADLLELDIERCGCLLLGRSGESQGSQGEGSKELHIEKASSNDGGCSGLKKDDSLDEELEDGLLRSRKLRTRRRVGLEERKSWNEG